MNDGASRMTGTKNSFVEKMNNLVVKFKVFFVCNTRNTCMRNRKTNAHFQKSFVNR